MNDVGLIILAAGNSSRLGRPKQLLLFRGKTLLNHIVAEGLAAGLSPMVVVTGAYSREMTEALKGEAVTVVFNPDWETGMASGIVIGLAQALAVDNGLQAVVVAVCDQPFVSAGLFRRLMERRAETGKGLIACSYAETLGTPVLFTAQYFKELSSLSGDVGAKSVLRRHGEDVATVDFPNGGIDIDTEDDLLALKNA
jgi:molybdenum cofactor cytidylyltransferase